MHDLTSTAILRRFWRHYEAFQSAKLRLGACESKETVDLAGGKQQRVLKASPYGDAAVSLAGSHSWHPEFIADNGRV